MDPLIRAENIFASMTGIDYSPKLIFDVGRLGEVRAYWDRGLSDLMRDPPDFDAVITELRDKLGSLMKE